MGCDIHGAVEVKSLNKWKYVSELKWQNRAYKIFCRLAGVRCAGSIDGASADYFISDDVSKTTKHEYDAWGSDAHSIKTMPAIQFIDAVIQDNEPWYIESTTAELIWAWLGIDELLFFAKGNTLDDFRVIIWFDN